MANRPIPGGGSGLQFVNYPYGDTTYTKVFVGGLAWETQSDTLYRYFEQFGEILEAVVITDKHTGRSKGYGFVTFCDPEAAKRACADPNPVIDGRRANCNLASFGRSQPSMPYGHMRSPISYFGNPQNPRGAYIRNPTYNQPVPYTYQPGFPYPLYGYPAYGTEYVYPQSGYNSYVGQQYLQMHGAPGTVNSNMLPYGHTCPLRPGNLGFATIQGYMVPGPRVMHYGRPNVSGATSEAIQAVQAPHRITAPPLGQPPIIIPAHPPLFTQNSGAEQKVG